MGVCVLNFVVFAVDLLCMVVTLWIAFVDYPKFRVCLLELVNAGLVR